MDIRLHLREERITETVRAEPLGDGRFRLLDNAIFQGGITRGTEIRTEPRADGTHVFIAVTKRSSFTTRRFFLSDKYRESDYRMLGDELMEHGGYWQVDFGGFLTINVPQDFPYDIDEVMTSLDVRLTEVVDDIGS